MLSNLLREHKAQAAYTKMLVAALRAKPEAGEVKEPAPLDEVTTNETVDAGQEDK